MQVIKNGQQSLNWTPLRLPDAGGPADNCRAGASERMQAYAGGPDSRQSAEPATRRIAPADEAAAILDQAHNEAARILADARNMASEIEREASGRAMEEARASIAAGAAAETDALRARLAESLEEVALLREQVAIYAERELVQLAVEIAKKIVRREVKVDREIVISLARVALARLHNRALATVHLHPDDYEYVLAHRDRLGTAGTVNLVEDPAISRGGCIIETDLGQVDARIEQQFSEVERGFLHDLEA